MRHVLALLALLLALQAAAVRADCGSIPFKADAQIFEPNQRAVIAFNGEQEILLLSTDLRSSEPTKVLEVIPFPSEPKVAKGDVEVFRSATALINEKLARRHGTLGGAGAMGGQGMAGGGAAESVPAAEVTLQKKIGAHDISVVHVLNRERFISWVEDYLKKAGVDNPAVSPAMKEVVAEYLKEKFEWFAFNVVELGTETATKEAVQYRFATRFLYYPLRISRTDTGATSIRLLLISPRLVKIPDLRGPKARLMHEPVAISPDELRSLDKDMHQLLGDRGNVKLRMWEIKGRLESFRRDVATTWF